jgi:EAL domain-containing protein (putative c-di-GMP-specific phosphodiesterase class I)
MSLHEIGSTCEGILEGAALGLLVDDVHIKLTASIGISDFSQLQCLNDVIVNAEIALGKAKKGKNKADYFLPDDRVAYNNRVLLEAEIRQCVLDGFTGFEIFYQPIISVALSMMVGTEALLRWRSRAGGIVSPAVVIPALLNIGMFEEVEAWVFKTAAEQCAKWAEMTGYDDFVMNINMSVKRAGKAGLAEELRQVVEASGVGMHNIFLEITEESFAMQNQSNVTALENLNNQGFLLAIDDFGTGYSSLGYIRNLPVSSLKIDRAFLLDIETNETSRKFVGNIIQLGHIMNYYVCVEGVETQAQARILTKLNADTLQGYHYSPPLHKDLLEQKFLTEMTSRARFDEIFEDLRGK